MLWEVVPHLSSSEAERPSAVSACSHLGDFYSLCIPKSLCIPTNVYKLYVQEVYTILKSMTQAGSFPPYEHVIF